MTGGGGVEMPPLAGGGRRREWLLLAVLASVQFVHIMDFVIVMPLGPQLMRSMKVSAREFGLVVSAYTFSASAAGLLAALVMDRFDRKTVLLALCAGFVVGTLLCAWAPTYETLVGARIVAGAFGGVMAAVVFAIVGDEIPPQRRGAAMGIVMSGFSAASVLGLPFGLYLANVFGWHAPFLLLSALSVGVLVLGFLALPPMRGHLVTSGRRAPLKEIAAVIAEPSHLRAFAVTVGLMFGGFSIVPFLSPYLVANVGVSERDLGYVYLVGGLATLVTGPLLGRLADRFGHARTFAWTAFVSVVPIALITNLPRVSLQSALAVTTLLMILMSGRMIAATALITGSVHPRVRGSFMSVNSSVQQLAAGLASLTAGLIIGGAPGGALRNYPEVGLLAVSATLLCIPLVRRLQRMGPSSEPHSHAPPPAEAEGFAA